MTNLEANMVKHTVIDIIMILKSVCSYIVAEPLYGLGFPTRRYVAQQFNCSNTTEGLENCSYDSFIDPQCYVGPHVAGVRCTQSKSFEFFVRAIYNMLNKTCVFVKEQFIAPLISTAPF